jgi:type IV pilus assembly protein PilN
MIERINLLPARQQRGTARTGGWLPLAVGLAVAVLAVLGVREIVLRGSLERRRAEIAGERDRLTAEQQSAAAALGRVRALADEKAALQARLDALAALQQGRRSWSELLVRIGQLTPEGLWLTAIESVVRGAGDPAAPVLQLQGKAFSHERISELLGTLEQDRDFTDVELISTAKGAYLDREVVDFKLSCRVRGR